MPPVLFVLKSEELEVAAASRQEWAAAPFPLSPWLVDNVMSTVLLVHQPKWKWATILFLCFQYRPWLILLLVHRPKWSSYCCGNQSSKLICSALTKFQVWPLTYPALDIEKVMPTVRSCFNPSEVIYVKAGSLNLVTALFPLSHWLILQQYKWNGWCCGNQPPKMNLGALTYFLLFFMTYPALFTNNEMLLWINRGAFTQLLDLWLVLRYAPTKWPSKLNSVVLSFKQLSFYSPGYMHAQDTVRSYQSG